MSLLETTIASITPQDQDARLAAKARLDQLIMPHWAMGKLMDLAMDLAGITRSAAPAVARRTVVTMAGDHGVVAEGVSAYPQEVTPQMVGGFVANMATINAMAKVTNTDVVVVDMGVAADLSELAKAGKILDRKVAPGTANMATGPAMTRQQAIQAIETGIAVANELADDVDIFGTGDMGIGNTTPSTAILAVLTDKNVADLTGHGTGIDDEQRDHKASVIEKAIATNAPDTSDPIDVLAKVGGFEIGGLAGLILGAAANHKPIVIDGFISTAGAMIAHAICPAVSEYLIAAHRSVEPGHRAMHERLGTDPLLDLNMRLGEGTGAALAMGLVEAAGRLLTDVATFDEAHVAEAQ